MPQSLRDKLVYDRIWQEDQRYEVSESFARLLDLCQREVHLGGRSAARIADLGCGHGRHALFAASHGAEVTAVDHNQVAIDRLMQKAEELRVPVSAIRHDIAEWLKTPRVGEFDGLVCFDVLHHLSSSVQAIRRVLRTMGGLVRPGGVILVTLLSQVHYGLGMIPDGRLMVSAERAEAILESVFRSAHVLAAKRKHRTIDPAWNLDPATGQLIRTSYEAVRVLRLYRMPGGLPLEALEAVPEVPSR